MDRRNLGAIIGLVDLLAFILDIIIPVDLFGILPEVLLPMYVIVGFVGIFMVGIRNCLGWIFSAAKFMTLAVFPPMNFVAGGFTLAIGLFLCLAFPGAFTIIGWLRSM